MCLCSSLQRKAQSPQASAQVRQGTELEFHVLRPDDRDVAFETEVLVAVDYIGGRTS
jgi:hypothetical protein